MLGLFAPAAWPQYGLAPPGTAGVFGQPGAFGGLSAPGLGAGGRRGWSVHPSLSVEETYTDNLNLAPRGAERSDWVTSVRPGISIQGNGARARMSVTYAPQLIYRAREETNDIFHALSAVGNAELMSRLLFVDASASIMRQDASLLGPRSQSDVNETGNRTTATSYALSPYLRHEFGYAARGEARFTHSTVRYSGNSLSTSDSDRIDVRLESGPAYKLLTWYTAYSKERIEYTEANQSVDLQIVSAGGRRLITPTLGVLANIGYEDNNYVTFGESPKGAFWNVGPQWTPTPRTQLAATVGRRYFGPARSLDFSHRTRLTAWHLQYSDAVTTTRGQTLIPTAVGTAAFLDALWASAIPDAAARQSAIATFINRTGLPPTLTTPLNFVTTVPFLQRRWQGSLGIHGVRNTLLTSLFTERREALGPAAVGAGAGDFGESTDIKQTGASVAWSLTHTPRAVSTVTLNYTRSEFPGLNREDRLKYLTATFTKQLQPRVSGSVSYRRLQNESNQSSGSGDYRENAIVVALNMRF